MTTATAPTETTTGTENTTKVYAAVKDGASTVSQVTELTGLAKSTVKTHLRHLVADGKVTATPGAKQTDPTVFAVKVKLTRAQKAAQAALESPDPLTENGIGRHPETRNASTRARAEAPAPAQGYRRNFTATDGPALAEARPTPVSHRAVKGENAKLLLAFFERTDGEQYTAKEVRQAVRSRWGVSNALYKLAEDGLVKREPRPDRPGYLWSKLNSESAESDES